MIRLSIALLVLASLLQGACAAIAPDWYYTCKTDEPVEKPLTIRRGETRRLVIAYTSRGAAQDLSGATAVQFRYTSQDPRTNSLYSAITGSIVSATSGVVQAIWTPAAAGTADYYAWEMAVLSGSVALVSANGPLTLAPGVGDAGAVPTEPDGRYAIDWSKVDNSNPEEGPYITRESADNLYLAKWAPDGTTIITNANGTISAIIGPSEDLIVREDLSNHKTNTQSHPDLYAHISGEITRALAAEESLRSAIPTNAAGISAAGGLTDPSAFDHAGTAAAAVALAGTNYATAAQGDLADSALQRQDLAGNGTNEISDTASGASQSGLANGHSSIGGYSHGALQRGRVSARGRMGIGSLAYGAAQIGYVGTGTTATNAGAGAMQLLNLTSNGQVAATTSGGAGSLLLGAGTASHKYSIVAGDGEVSHGDGSVTAGGGIWSDSITLGGVERTAWPIGFDSYAHWLPAMVVAGWFRDSIAEDMTLGGYVGGPGYVFADENGLLTNWSSGYLWRDPWYSSIHAEAMPAPVAHWLLNDATDTVVVVDSAGDHQGASEQVTSAMAAAGRVNGALAFNGTSDRVSVSNAAVFHFGTADFTVALWVKFNTVVGEMFRIGSYGAPGEVRLFVEYSQPKVTLKTATGTIADEYVADPVSSQVWTHMCLTRSGTNFGFYVDGVGTWTKISDSAILDEGTGPVLGMGDEWLDGWLDDVRVYTNALSGSQVAVLAAGTEVESQEESTSTVTLVATNSALPVAGSTIRAYGAVQTVDRDMAASDLTLGVVDIERDVTYWGTSLVWVAETAPSNQLYASDISAPTNLPISDAAPACILSSNSTARVIGLSVIVAP